MNAPNPVTIVVVDDDPHRYEFLSRQRARVIYLPDGCSALRLSTSFQQAYWLVNSQLPDMTGIECIEMLVELYPQSRLFLIGDHYEADVERLCFRFPGVKYVCRPLDVQWLGRLLQSPPLIKPSSEARPGSKRPHKVPSRFTKSTKE